MATQTSNFLLQVKDKDGNMYILYPITRAENIEDLDEYLEAYVSEEELPAKVEEILGGTDLLDYEVLSQEEYDALEEKEEDKLYIIQGEDAPSAISLTVPLTASGWTASGSVYMQTVSAVGVDPSRAIFISPSPGSAKVYAENEIMCTAEAKDSLTFESKTAVAVEVNIAVL